MGHSRCVHFLYVCSHLTGSVESHDFDKPLQWWLQCGKKEVPRPSGSSGIRTSLVPHAVELAVVTQYEEVTPGV